MTPPHLDAVYSARIPPAPPRRADGGAGHPALGAQACPSVSVVVPLFDEQETLPELYRRLTVVMRGMPGGYELVFVNDGSRDGTASLLDGIAAGDENVAVVHFSRNFGHQAAVTAGLRFARGRAVVVMDGDLQDPPELIPQLVRAWEAGGEVVYAVRASRAEGPLRRLGYFLFYRLLRAVSDLEIPLDAGDFCLMDRRAAAALNRLPERHRFVRGLRAFVGFRQVGVPYDRDPRRAGRPKYTLGKLLQLAADGLFGFSAFPIRAVAVVGLVLVAAAVPAWVAAGASPGAILLVGGLQLIGTGAIGEYVRRAFLEASGRPAYVIREVVRRGDHAEQFSDRDRAAGAAA